MADIYASNWDETDANNTTAAPDGMPEGMSPSGVNNWGRAVAGAFKRYVNQQIPKITGGTSTAYTLSYGVTPGALVDAMTHLVQFNAVNGASPTLNVNTLGAKPLHFYCGGSWAAMPANMLAIDQVVQVTYNSAAGAYRCIGLPLVLTQSVSAVSLIDFTGIPSNVNHIECRFEVRPTTDGATLVVQTFDTAGNLDSGGSDYAWWATSFSGAGPTPTVASAIGASIVLTGGVDNGVTGASGVLHAENIQAATYTKFCYDLNYLESTGVSGVGITGRGQRLEADRITGIRIAPSGGTVTGKATLTFVS